MATLPYRRGEFTTLSTVSKEDTMSDSNKALKEKLLSSRKNGFDRVDAAELEQMEAYCKEYMTFLDAGKTERLCAAETVRLAEQAGYKP